MNGGRGAHGRPGLQRVLRGYRPLYLRGLLLDGQYRLPPASQAKPVRGPRAARRALLAALAGVWRHGLPFRRPGR